MTNLSPAAQAVIDAYYSTNDDLAGPALAAALRAAADLIKPDLNRIPWITDEDGYFNETLENMEALGELNAHYRFRAIADVLDGGRQYATQAWSDGTHQRFKLGIAAALRAAACQLTTARSIDKLRAIADELGAVKYGTYRCELEEQ